MQNKNVWWIVGGIVLIAVLAIVLRGDKGVPRQEGLPEAVETKRQAIYAAAARKDYEHLETLIGSPFRYSFGGENPGGFDEFLKVTSENLPNQESKQKDIFAVIRKILALPYGVQGDIYVWPAVFAKGAGDWTEEDLAQMRELFSEELIESYRQFGGYAYYRAGINSAGEWVYFIAGD